MANTSRKSRTVRKGVNVTAVQSAAGPAATSVHVQVEPRKLEEELGERADIQEVIAAIPSTVDGELQWLEEHLQKVETEVQPAENAQVVEHYSTTHYGPSDAKELGVGVTVKTRETTVTANESGERYSVAESDRPPDSERRRFPSDKPSHR